MTTRKRYFPGQSIRNTENDERARYEHTRNASAATTQECLLIWIQLIQQMFFGSRTALNQCRYRRKLFQ